MLFCYCSRCTAPDLELSDWIFYVAVAKILLIQNLLLYSSHITEITTSTGARFKNFARFIKKIFALSATIGLIRFTIMFHERKFREKLKSM